MATRKKTVAKATIKATTEDVSKIEAEAKAAVETELDLENEVNLSEDMSPKQVAKAAAEEAKASAVVEHSKQYYELLRMLQEYAERCIGRTVDRAEILKRAKVLFSIVKFVAPSARATDKVLARELCQLLFEKLIAGSGTIYSDNQLFKLTYTLPPSDAVKFEAFWTAFLQLVNKQLAKQRITFDNDALRATIKNDGVMEFVIATRKRLESASNV